MTLIILQMKEISKKGDRLLRPKAASVNYFSIHFRAHLVQQQPRRPKPKTIRGQASQAQYFVAVQKNIHICH